MVPFKKLASKVAVESDKLKALLSDLTNPLLITLEYVALPLVGMSLATVGTPATNRVPVLIKGGVKSAVLYANHSPMRV